MLKYTCRLIINLINNLYKDNLTYVHKVENDLQRNILLEVYAG